MEKHVIRILFGESAVLYFEETDRSFASAKRCAEEHGGLIIVREFKNREEKIAYIHGINDATGWQNHTSF